MDEIGSSGMDGDDGGADGKFEFMEDDQLSATDDSILPPPHWRSCCNTFLVDTRDLSSLIVEWPPRISSHTVVVALDSSCDHTDTHVDIRWVFDTGYL